MLISTERKSNKKINPRRNSQNLEDNQLRAE